MEIFGNKMETLPNKMETFPNKMEIFSNKMDIFPNEMEIFPNEMETFPNEMETFPNKMEIYCQSKWKYLEMSLETKSEKNTLWDVCLIIQSLFTEVPEIEKEEGKNRIPLPYSPNAWTEFYHIWLKYISDEQMKGLRDDF